jgi:hypothetical protein
MPAVWAERCDGSVSGARYQRADAYSASVSLATKSLFPALVRCLHREGIRLERASESKRLILSGPFRGQVAQSCDAHATRQLAIHRGIHETWRKEGQRDRHVDLSRAALFSGRNIFSRRFRIGQHLAEPSTPTGNRSNQKSSGFGANRSNAQNYRLRNFACVIGSATVTWAWLGRGQRVAP